MQRIKIDLSSKKAQVALRFFTYGVMALATILLTTLAIFYALGYRFNKDFNFEQGGVAQFRSVPSGAMVFVDGQREENTPSRAYLDAGSHEVYITHENYKPWSKRVSLQPGQLLWLDYIRFVPSQVKTTSLKSYQNVENSLTSPDRRWIVIQPESSSRIFNLVDVSRTKEPKIEELEIPEALLTKKDDKLGKISLIEWSQDSKYVLLRHTNGETNEVLRLDREDSDRSVNISRTFGLNIGEAHFASGNILYALTGDVLRRLDVPAGSASAALVSGAKTFMVNDDNYLAFVAEQNLVKDESASLQTVVGILQNGEETIVKTYEGSKSVRIDLTEYYRKARLAISVDGEIQILQDPTSQAQSGADDAVFKQPREVRWMQFSDNGRFLAAGSDNGWFTYDIETSLDYDVNVQGGAISEPKWLDNFHFAFSQDDKLIMTEFDGANSSEITQAKGNLPASLSPNGEAIFGFNIADGKNNFTSSSLFNE